MSVYELYFTARSICLCKELPFLFRNLLHSLRGICTGNVPHIPGTSNTSLAGRRLNKKFLRHYGNKIKVCQNKSGGVHYFLQTKFETRILFRKMDTCPACVTAVLQDSVVCVRPPLLRQERTSLGGGGGRGVLENCLRNV